MVSLWSVFLLLLLHWQPTTTRLRRWEVIRLLTNYHCFNRTISSLQSLSCKPVFVFLWGVHVTRFHVFQLCIYALEHTWSWLRSPKSWRKKRGYTHWIGSREMHLQTSQAGAAVPTTLCIFQVESLVQEAKQISFDTFFSSILELGKHHFVFSPCLLDSLQFFTTEVEFTIHIYWMNDSMSI